MSKKALIFHGADCQPTADGHFGSTAFAQPYLRFDLLDRLIP